MPFGRAIFNNNKRFHWCETDDELVVSLSRRDLTLKWFVDELFYPECPDYDWRIHKDDISVLLDYPEKLVEFEISEEVKRRVLELADMSKPRDLDLDLYL